MKPLIHTALIVIPAAAAIIFSVLPRTPAQNWDKTVIIEIQKEDFQSLGNWPIERRWYGLAIENLVKQGADSIFIDIAFYLEDPLRPESDDFFYDVLQKNPDIFLQNDRAGEKQNISIMGGRPFPVNRTFLPFSESMTVSGNLAILYNRPEQSLAAYLGTINPGTGLAVPIPAMLPAPDFTFLQILRNEFEISLGANVFIYLDHPGVTSYINSGTQAIFPVSMVQWWAIHQMKGGNGLYMWPDWMYYLPVIMLLLSSANIIFRNRLHIMLISSLYPIAAIYVLTLWGLNAYIPGYLAFVAIIPIPFFVWTHVRAQWILQLPNELFEQTDRALSEAEKKELENLRYRVGFYDKLKQVRLAGNISALDTGDIICHGESPLVEILKKARYVAGTTIPVLITGESGTGKEELAKFIHLNSERADHPFIAVNCGSLNENLIESELFGYEKGAFTGADKIKKGRFELADGGTLFLDEIAETSISFQVNLLRILQEGSYERVGGTEVLHSSVRIITATHQDPRRLVRESLFREDLFYRLNGFSFHLPALRERKMDIPVLFQHFVHQNSGGEELHYSESLLDWLQLQTWSGNIRELKSAVSRAVINAELHGRQVLIPEDFELEHALYERNEKAVQIRELFREYSENYRFISKVANSIDMHRVTVTEYFRGWIIYYMVRGLNAGQIAVELSMKESKKPPVDQLADRITSYQESIVTKIKKAIIETTDPTDIQAKYFNQLPGFFSEDLLQLIKYHLPNEK